MNEKYYVIAGTTAQARDFIMQKCEAIWQAGHKSISLSNFIIVASVDNLLGVKDPKGWLVGTWRERADIKDIIAHIVLRKVKTITPEFQKIMNEFGYKTSFTISQPGVGIVHV